MPEAMRESWTNSWLAKGLSPRKVHEYVYHDSSGRAIVKKNKYALMKVEDGSFSGQKTFTVHHRSGLSVRLGADRWESGIGGRGRGLLYRLPELLAGIEAGADVYLCEGEKDADSLADLGVVATSHYQGAAGITQDQAAILAGAKRLFIVMDRDLVGYQIGWHALKLIGKGEFRTAAVKGDATDHVASGLGLEALRHVEHEAVRSVIEKHGELPRGKGHGYGYANASDGSDGDSGIADAGWQTTVVSSSSSSSSRAGKDILADVEANIRRYLVLPDENAYVAATLWVAATHAMPGLEHASRLVLVSAVPQCGKSRTLEVLSCMSQDPLQVSNASVSAIFRTIDMNTHTIFHDEADTVWGSNSNGNEDLRGLYNAGFRRGATFLRSAKEEGEWTPRKYNVFGMVALASKGDVLPETIMQRAIVIRMRKRLPREKVSNFRSRNEKALRDLGAEIADWARDVDGTADPDNPLENRDADVWEPLFIMADEAGGDWPDRVRRAAVEMVGSESDVAPEDPSIDLLRDIVGLWPANQDHWWTNDMINTLVTVNSRWERYDYGRPINAVQLAGMLSGYGIAPKLIKRKGEVQRGYRRGMFSDAEERYLTEEATDVEG